MYIHLYKTVDVDIPPLRGKIVWNENTDFATEIFGGILENKELLPKPFLLVEACGLSSSLLQQLQFLKSILRIVE